MNRPQWVPGWAEWFTVVTSQEGKSVYIEFYARQDDGPLPCRPVAELGSTQKAKGPRNKYDREIRPGVWVDVYDVLGAFIAEKPDPTWVRAKASIDYAMMRLLFPGQIGSGCLRQDLTEARDSIDRAIQQIDEWV